MNMAELTKGQKVIGWVCAITLIVLLVIAYFNPEFKYQ